MEVANSRTFAVKNSRDARVNAAAARRPRIVRLGRGRGRFTTKIRKRGALSKKRRGPLKAAPPRGAKQSFVRAPLNFGKENEWLHTLYPRQSGLRVPLLQ
ncbi:hypothetical protein EVAR_65987_1 [Eumeta japonica]|uniref:Uncharacterized protein n=1 Tax=Eumeta variegata TaxID=151549 RepID=A0A4C1ZJB9_EUMVA|nr:hypothetical protein EVAR_65987_1 [Eumeta japonica]